MEKVIFTKMNKSSYLQNTYYPGSFYRYLIHKNILELSLQYDFNNIQIKKKCNMKYNIQK